MTLPHRLTAADVLEAMALVPLVIAIADTADRTQVKNFTVRGLQYTVTRAYLDENGEEEREEPEVVYSGPDLEAAVRAYNLLS